MRNRLVLRTLVRNTLITTGLLLLGNVLSSTLPSAVYAQGASTPQAGSEKLPEIAREYRGVWVATVSNIDWPSKPGLSTDQQKEEIIAILDKTVELRMNFIVLQVRTSCDAFYPSEYEPWSYYLTGEQGKAPAPFYDPLEFWVEEAHKRGLELHAWFNPFRAKNSGQRYKDSEKHISNTKPSLVKKYGNDKTSYLWLDPGEEEARQHSLNVFMDVVKRYDIDGVHIDDYFYPYPVDGIEFSDEPAWEKYVASGGKSPRADWRRESMNAFIENLYKEIKATKPHVKFGISPFGIWKSGYPAGTAGMSQYDALYADAKLWLNKGWIDYYTPQLYWAINSKQQSFPALLAWWISENTQERHIAPGIYTGRVQNPEKGYSADQLESQVYVARYMPGSHGTVHFSMKSLQRNWEKIGDKLRDGAYSKPAIIPASPWIDDTPPAPPVATLDKTKSEIQLSAPESDNVRQWCIYRKIGSSWSIQVIGAKTTAIPANTSEGAPKSLAITAIDGAGNQSQPTFVELPIK